MKYPLHVTSEIGELKSVLLHRPGGEIENLVPDYLPQLLFDDIPYLPAIQQEHDYFARTLQNQGIEVLYLENLAAESLYSNEIREQFVDQILKESKADATGASSHLREYLMSLSGADLINKVMAGIRKNEVVEERKTHLYEMMDDHRPFYLDPMPNLYFTRDPAATIGKGVSINRMRWGARRRESMFLEYIIRYHPQFSHHRIPVWFGRNGSFSMEGGDQLVLSENVVAIGVSERTTAQAVEAIAVKLLATNSNLQRVVAIEIPKMRAFMHLDTVFTMVNRDQFTIHPAVMTVNDEMNIFILERGKDSDLKISRRTNLIETLKEVLHLKQVDFIPCGGGDSISAAREQWNDGSNTLSIAPGVVVTYDRNYESNKSLREHGIQVIEVPGSELGRGRGGPRCMTMPLIRTDI